MHQVTPDSLERSRLRQAALSRWDNEGGAGNEALPTGAKSRKVPPAGPKLTNAELVHLRIRVIALENLVISMLAEASERQLDHAREMAAVIMPRADATQHPLTTHAAEHMVDLVQRACHFRTLSANPGPRCDL